MIEEKNKDEVMEATDIPSDTQTPPAEENIGTPPDSGDKKGKRRDDKPFKAEITRLEAELREAKKQLEQKNTELDTANDKYMRMIAEYDNYRKRMTKERENTYNEACADVVAEMLPILDNLERASAFTDAKEVSQGVSMLCKLFADTISKLGVSEIEALGCAFDPNIHNAVMHIEDDAYGENEIIEVLQKGYAKGDKVIRYAMVKVAN